MLIFTTDFQSEGKPLSHYWEKCVGSCHAYTALREDYRQQLKKAHEQAGFQYLRFHGLLNDDMSIVVREEDGSLRYNFFNIDSIFDFLLDIGMKPFLELGFMPEALASTEKTCFHYKGNISLPKDYKEWEELIGKLTDHLIQRYGAEEVHSWFFEVWNEPNLSFFFEGTQSDYFELYAHTARAIKAVDAKIQVGGPATSNNKWIPEFIAYCESNQVPLDFISTHHYPTDDPLWSGCPNKEFYDRGVLTEMTRRAKKESGSYPLYYTEWNSSARNPDEVHDIPYTAALAAKTIIDNVGLVEAYSFWTFTDIFEEGGQFPGEFYGGFGMQTVHGIPKPVFRTFEFLHQLGTQQLPVSEEQETVGMIVTTTEKGICMLAYNHQVPGSEIEEQEVCFRVQNFKASGASMTLVDDDHGNARKIYEEWGFPEYVSREEVKKLDQAATVQPQELPLQRKGEDSEIRFRLKPHGIALIQMSSSL